MANGDPALAYGLNKGLLNFWEAYQGARKEKRAEEQSAADRALKERQAAMEMAAKGLTVEDDRIVPTKESLAKQAAENALKEAQARYYARRSSGQGQVAQAKPTKGQEAVDRAFAKEYADYIGAGGMAGLQSKIGQVKDVQSEISSGKSNLSGPFLGLLPTGARAVVAPRSVDVQQTLEGAIQETLRQTLGAQYTEREGRELMARAYNPQLSEEENAKRVGRLLDRLRGMAEAKNAAMEYFRSKGTLAGFQGNVPSLDDVRSIDIDADRPDGGDAYADELDELDRMSDEEISELYQKAKKAKR